jgi:hypothetical protein
MYAIRNTYLYKRVLYDMYIKACRLSKRAQINTHIAPKRNHTPFHTRVCPVH